MFENKKYLEEMVNKNRESAEKSGTLFGVVALLTTFWLITVISPLTYVFTYWALLITLVTFILAVLKQAKYTVWMRRLDAENDRLYKLRNANKDVKEPAKIIQLPTSM